MLVDVTLSDALGVIPRTASVRAPLVLGRAPDPLAMGGVSTGVLASPDLAVGVGTTGGGGAALGTGASLGAGSASLRGRGGGGGAVPMMGQKMQLMQALAWLCQ